MALLLQFSQSLSDGRGLCLPSGVRNASVRNASVNPAYQTSMHSLGSRLNTSITEINISSNSIGAAGAAVL